VSTSTLFTALFSPHREVRGIPLFAPPPSFSGVRISPNSSPHSVLFLLLFVKWQLFSPPSHAAIPRLSTGPGTSDSRNSSPFPSSYGGVLLFRVPAFRCGSPNSRHSDTARAGASSSPAQGLFLSARLLCSFRDLFRTPQSAR